MYLVVVLAPVDGGGGLSPVSKPLFRRFIVQRRHCPAEYCWTVQLLDRQRIFIELLEALLYFRVLRNNILFTDADVSEKPLKFLVLVDFGHVVSNLAPLALQRELIW